MLKPCKAAGTEWSKEAITPVPENPVTSPDFGGHWGHSYGAQACLQAKHLHTLKNKKSERLWFKSVVSTS